MFKGKEIEVALVGNAKETYLELKNHINKEIEKGKIGTINQKLILSIDRSIGLLKLDPQYGIHIKKKQIPLYYINKFGAQNLWKYNLALFWRLIYWIDGSYNKKIICFVLDIMDHKRYNKIFNYRKH